MILVANGFDAQTKIVECVDCVFNELGQSVGKAIYFHAEAKFGIRREEIPNQSAAFCQALRSIFGDGTDLIERLIVQKIHAKFKISVEAERNLVEVIEEIKSQHSVSPSV